MSCIIPHSALNLPPLADRYQRYGARYSMLLATAFLAFSGVIRCVPVTHGRSFMVLVQLSMRLVQYQYIFVFLLAGCDAEC